MFLRVWINVSKWLNEIWLNCYVKHLFLFLLKNLLIILDESAKVIIKILKLLLGIFDKMV